MCILAQSGERQLVELELRLPDTTLGTLDPSNNQLFHGHPLQLCPVVDSRRMTA